MLIRSGMAWKPRPNPKSVRERMTVSQSSWVGLEREVEGSTVKKDELQGTPCKAEFWTRWRAAFVKVLVVPAGPVARTVRTIARRLVEWEGQKCGQRRAENLINLLFQILKDRDKEIDEA